MGRSSRLTLLSLFAVNTVAATGVACHISSPHAILMTAEGKVLFEKGADKKAFPASTTKLAAALYLLNRYPDKLSHSVIADHDSICSLPQKEKEARHYKIPAHWLEENVTHIGIKNGEQFLLEDLFEATLVASASDASNVIAKYISGSVAAFTEELNLYLKQIGCTKTHFCNPHGVHHPDHVTTARDMVLVAKEALKQPKIMEAVKKGLFCRPKTNKQPSALFPQTNRLLKKRGVFYYPHAIGMKTGFTSHAKSNLIAAATNGKRTLIAVILTAPNRDQLYQEMISLFEAGFNEKEVKKTLLPPPQSCSIAGAQNTLFAAVQAPFHLTYYPSETPTVEWKWEWNTALEPPIAKGAFVGQAKLFVDNKEVALLPLFATQQVDPHWYYGLWKWWTQLNWKPLYSFVSLILLTLFSLFLLTKKKA